MMLRSETAVEPVPTGLVASAAVDGVPPGPRFPLPLQTLAMMTRQRAFLRGARRRFGPLFTVRVFGLGTLVMVADPELIKQTFQADARTLHAGTESPLRRILGPNSMLGIDEEQHMEQRRLLLPPFKGQRMRTYEPLIAEIAAAEIDTWPSGAEFASNGSMQRITLRAILRALFGAEGSRLEQLERLVPPWTTLGSRLATMTFLQHDFGRRSPWRRFLELRRSIDLILDELIAVAKADRDLEERPDVLALMVLARHQDGQPMSNPEIRDELVTMIAAGHETTAHTLSWAIDRLRRHPELLRRLVEEADAGGKALREATIREVQRVRPVISFAGRSVRQPYELGGYRLPIGTRVLLAANLTHDDPTLFPHPERFDPDRFLGVVPDTYAWIPFGGGRRRCIGASFAHMELDVVLRTILERVELQPTTEPGERWRFRGVAWGPADGGQARVTRRTVTPRQAIAA
jgi:cytochrome P450